MSAGSIASLRVLCTERDRLAEAIDKARTKDPGLPLIEQCDRLARLTQAIALAEIAANGLTVWKGDA